MLYRLWQGTASPGEDPAGLSNLWAVPCPVSTYMTRYPPYSSFLATKRKTSLHHSGSLCTSYYVLPIRLRLACIPLDVPHSGWRHIRRRGLGISLCDTTMPAYIPCLWLYILGLSRLGCPILSSLCWGGDVSDRFVEFLLAL